MILGGGIDSTKFGGKWPKIWPTCIFRPGEGLDGLKSDFGGKNKFGQKWPKIWPICIFRPGKSLDGLKSDLGGEKKIRPKMAENMANMYF